MLLVLAAFATFSLAAPSRHNPDPGFGGPTGGSNLGGIQIVDPNNPDPGFGGPSGSNLGGIHVVDHNNPDPGFSGPSGR